MSERLSISLPATPERVPTARGAITLLCEELEVEAALAGDIRLAVTEACTNCVLHAYVGDCPDEHPTFALEARVEDDELLVVVRDSGSGELRPRGGSGGLGFGLGLMRQLASSVDVLARPGRGTRVALRFALR
ncbi:MAG TPA: ATP-binding protein [Gaiellales bacterium]|jgi:anti-sigma regulatory factor (Ser/Thr protein kinase)